MFERGTLGTEAGTRDYYYLFDYLRIALAVGVFIAHATPLGWVPEQFGNAFVHVFFALSGFLIGGILLASTPASLPRFYFNRSTRIWIPYGIAILLLLGGTALRQNLHDAKLWQVFFYKATFVYNVFGPSQLVALRGHVPLDGTGNHFWSICVEEQFYLVAPFLMLFIKRLRVPVLVGLVILNCFWAHKFASVALGVLLALSRHQFGTWYLRQTGRAACALALVVASAVLWSRPETYAVSIGYIAVAIVALTAVPGKASRLGVVLGGMSYPFYLNHWIGLFLRKQIGRVTHLGNLGTGLVALSIALGFSYAHYRFVDLPIHERRKLWYTPRRGVIACCVGIALVAVGLAVGFALRDPQSSWS